MTKLTWDGDRECHQGVDRGVLYPTTGPGEAWNGLTSVTESPLESQVKSRYIDGVKVSASQPKGEFSGTIEAFTYPSSFYADVLLQKRAPRFGFSYRVMIEDSYEIHIVYNATTSPSRRQYQQRETSAFSWNFTTIPIDVPGAKKAAHLIVSASVAYSWTVQAIEDILYGTETTDPRLPTPQEIWDVVEENSILLVVDHGDGTFTITGPDDAITDLGSNTFEVTWPSVINIDADTYQISSL